MVVEPRLDEFVELLELAFGAGFGRAAFEPTEHAHFDLVDRHFRTPGVDAFHRLLDRQSFAVGPDDLAPPGVDAGIF